MEAMEEPPESIPDLDPEISLFQKQAGLWTTVEVILDAVFKFLPIEDLKSARLVSKKWCSVGAISLASRAIVRLSNEIFDDAVPPSSSDDDDDDDDYDDDDDDDFDDDDDDKSSVFRGDERDNFVKYRGEFRWGRCLCKKAFGTHLKFYTTLKAYIRDKAWDSGFRPKRVSILGCQNVWRLPKFQFSGVEELEVIKFKSSEATWLHHQLGTFFPNLKCLELVDLELNPRPKGCSECECTCWSRSTDNPDTSMVPADTTKLPLEKLVMAIGPCWNKLPWDVLKRSAKFHVLELVLMRKVPWSSIFSHDEAEYPELENVFLTCLKDVDENADCIPHLNQVKLSFFLKTAELENTLVALLNKLTLEKLALEIRWGNVDLLLSFLSKLSYRTMRALETLCCKERIQENDVEDDLKSFFETLGRQGFFTKDVWNIWIGFRNGLRFWKTRGQFVLQSFSKESLPKNVAQILQNTLIPQGYLPNVYNYMFHNFEGYNYNHNRNKIQFKVNEIELYREFSIFNPTSLNPKRKSVKSWRLPCDSCLKVPKLLCDLPGFCEEAGIDMNVYNHNYEDSPFIRTWTFRQVSAEVISKWSAKLASKRAAAEKELVCQCPRAKAT